MLLRHTILCNFDINVNYTEIAALVLNTIFKPRTERVTKKLAQLDAVKKSEEWRWNRL